MSRFSHLLHRASTRLCRLWTRVLGCYSALSMFMRQHRGYRLALGVRQEHVRFADVFVNLWTIILVDVPSNLEKGKAEGMSKAD